MEKRSVTLAKTGNEISRARRNEIPTRYQRMVRTGSLLPGEFLARVAKMNRGYLSLLRRAMEAHARRAEGLVDSQEGNEEALDLSSLSSTSDEDNVQDAPLSSQPIPIPPASSGRRTHLSIQDSAPSPPLTRGRARARAQAAESTTPTPTQDSSQIPFDLLCEVCMRAKWDSVAFPCRHGGICQDCRLRNKLILIPDLNSFLALDLNSCF